MDVLSVRTSRVIGRLRASIARVLLRVQQLVLAGLTAALFGADAASHEPERILVLRTGALGDFLFAVPALRALRRRFPTAEILLLTTPTTHRATLSKVQRYSHNGAPWLDFVVPYVVDRALLFSLHDLRSTRAEMASELARFRPDVCFMLTHPAEEFSSLVRKIVFLRLVGVRCPTYGWRKRATYAFARDVWHGQGLLGHKVMGPMNALAECKFLSSLSEADVEFEVAVEPMAMTWARETLAEHSCSHKAVVAIAPGSIQPHKRWPIERFVGIAKQLADDGAAIVIIGTRSDAEWGERIRAEVPGVCLNLAGTTSIMQSAAILSACTILIANDGGAAHLASAVGCPCVSIANGIEFPGSVEPWNDRESVARVSVPCSPCYSFTSCPRGDHVCVTGVTTPAVMELVRMRLRHRPTAERT